MKSDTRRRRGGVAFVSLALLASIAFVVIRSSAAASGGRDDVPEGDGPPRLGRRRLLHIRGQFSDPKTVTLRDVPPPPYDPSRRERCRILYIMGVEGASHHGVTPVVERLARAQLDDDGAPYDVVVESQPLKAGLLGWYHHYYRHWGIKNYKNNLPPVDDPTLVRSVVESICPDDGRTHVVIEWTSFPSGEADDPRSYRIHRQLDWPHMTPEEIAESGEALNHPANMTAFVEAYLPYAQVRFVVIHRPFLETIASHHKWDGGSDLHSNVLRGYMLILRRFLDAHPLDPVDGARLWTLLCVDRIMGKNYPSAKDADAARRIIVAGLARFMRWSVEECPDCFDDWKDSRKDPAHILRLKGTLELLTEQAKALEGTWPPPGEEGVEEQRCAL